MAFKISSWWACWCSMGCGPEHILELWLRIGVKYVEFYGLWPIMTSLELWLGIADEHEELWVVARVGECAGVSVLVVASTDGSNRLPSSVVADEFGSPRTLRTIFVFENSTWRYGVGSVAWFPHVLYRLWPIGVAARHLEILTIRCRTLLTWLWPCERNGTRFPDVLNIHGGGHV